MSPNPSQSPEQVLKVLNTKLREEGKFYPATVGELGLSSIDSWSGLQRLVFEGKVIPYRAPMVPIDSPIVQIAAPEIGSFFSLGWLLILGVPLLGVVLGIIESGWFFLLLLSVPIGFRSQTNRATNLIIKAALRSEIEFCMLFNTGAIRLMDSQGEPVQ